MCPRFLVHFGSIFWTSLLADLRIAQKQRSCVMEQGKQAKGGQWQNWMISLFSFFQRMAERQVSLKSVEGLALFDSGMVFMYPNCVLS